MSGGKFQGTVSGTWSTTHSVSAGTVATVLVGVAVVSHLGEILRILAALLAVVIVLAVPAVILMRRWTSREYARHQARLAEQPDEPRPAVKAPQPVIQIYGGTHLYLDGRASDPRVIQAFAEPAAQPAAYPTHLEGGEQR